MKCPDCKIDLINGCCLRCGYMENGNRINKEYSALDKFKEQKLYNKNFDFMYRNEKVYINFLLGPLYFSYRGYLILGILFVLLDYLLLLCVGNFISSVPLVYVYIFLNRVLYATFANSICLLIDNIKIECIKMRYKDSYLDKIKNHKHRKIYLLITIIFYFIIILGFMIVKRYQNGLLQ